MLRAGGRLRTVASSTDAAALAWAEAVTANSGTYSATTLRAVSDFAKSAKVAGYWDKLIRINLLCGDQLAAALVPLKTGGGNATDTNNNFVSGDYTEATGLTGDGTTKYLETGLIPSTHLTLNSTHMALYNRSSSAGSRADMGASANYYLNGTFTDGKVYTQMGTSLVSGVLSTPYGFLVASRTAADAQEIYQGGTSVASNSAASDGLPISEYFVLATNNGVGTAENFSTAPVGAYSIGLGLNDSEAAAYNTHMEAFQDALGRGVQS